MQGQGERLTMSIPSHPRYLRVVRGFLESLLLEVGFSSTEGMRVVLAVHEACANVIAHGYQGDTAQRIDLAVEVAVDSITVEIHDYSTRPQPAVMKPRDLQDVRPGGLGTYFMQAIMDAVEYDLSGATGTIVRMTKRRSTPCTRP